MNLTKIKPYFIGILIIAIILIFFTLIVSFVLPEPRPQRPSPSPPPATPPPTPFQTASPTAKLKQQTGFETELEKISKFLPYSGVNFTVEYVAPLNLINAKIKANSVEEYFNTKTQIEEYIKSKGVADICKLNIFWIPQVNPTVRESLKNTEALITTGCKIIKTP